jgi:hypothetical protein
MAEDEKDSELRLTVAAALELIGLARTAERLDITPASVLRLATGQSTRGVTRKLARANLGRLAETEARTSP